jgi:DNA-directed RNA polymerase specialized sigma24 family protein
MPVVREMTPAEGRAIKSHTAARRILFDALDQIDTRRPSFPPAPPNPRRVSTWLYAAVANAAIDLYHRGRRARLEDPITDYAEYMLSSVDVEQEAIAHEAAAVLRAAVAMLPDRYRGTLFALLNEAIEGPLTPCQKSRIHRGISMLRERMPQ